MGAPMHVELHVECLALALDADGCADEGDVRRALVGALDAADGLSDLRGHGVAEVVARQVAREVRGAVPPC